MKLSEREKSFPASPIRYLWPYALEAKKRGIEVYHLNIGQPDIETPRAIFSAIKGFNSPVLPYGPSDGLPELREVIAQFFKRYDVNVSPEEVFITTGGSEAILFSFLTVCDYGDNILIPEPFYTNYMGFARMAGIEIIPIPTKVEEGFHLPERKIIEGLVNRKTKAILICSPNNPTGTVYGDEEMEMIIDVAKKKDLFVLSDEVYREIVFDGLTPKTIFHYSKEENIIVLDSISKRFSACGARIGFAVSSNRDVLNTFLRLGQARLCPPTIEQVGAREGFLKIDDFLKDMVKEYERRRNAVMEELDKIPGVLSHKPQGAFYTVVRLPVKDSPDFARWLLSDFEYNGKTLMVAPAPDFYATPGRGMDEIRIAFVLEDGKIREAIKILLKGIEEYNSR
jgi:aspartate aminotransferase